jgi:hypothetical protein
VKEKVANQLLKNKELLSKAVEETLVEGVDGYHKVVLDAVNFAPVVGLSWGGDEKQLLDLFFVIDKEKDPLIDVFVPRVKGKRELKNLDCSINFEARVRKSS